MKLNRYISYMAVAGMVSLVSCNDFLDKLPDNRVDPDNPDQLLKVLVGGYSSGNYGAWGELSSDNIVDNCNLGYTTLQAGDPMEDQMFAWEDVDLSSNQDSPTSIWSNAYGAIAAANHVLEKIEEFKADGRYTSGTDKSKMDAAYGEAMLIRAYNHFVLVNLFAPQYRGEQSANDQGIPYSTEPETVPGKQYERLSVKAVYDQIEADLQEGLQYVNDQFYSQPKWHFNTSAANAFAARFYLFKRDYKQAEHYATLAIGTDPAGVTRSDFWSTTFTSHANAASAYFSSSSPNNLLLIPTESTQMILLYVSQSSAGPRYACNDSGLVGTLYAQGAFYSGNYNPAIADFLYTSGEQRYGAWPNWLYWMFQYTDKVAMIGYPKAIRAEFTGEDAILMRAEARIYNGNKPGAVSDLQAYAKSFQGVRGTWYDLTEPVSSGSVDYEDRVAYYYRRGGATSAERDPRPYNQPELHIDDIYPVTGANVTEDMLPYLWCVLHFRRFEHFSDGMRWFDIKRYGIEIEHKIGNSRVEKLVYDDPRRAFQVPIEALSSGLAPTKRTANPVDESSLKPYISTAK